MTVGLREERVLQFVFIFADGYVNIPVRSKKITEMSRSAT